MLSLCIYRSTTVFDWNDLGFLLLLWDRFWNIFGKSALHYHEIYYHVDRYRNIQRWLPLHAVEMGIVLKGSQTNLHGFFIRIVPLQRSIVTMDCHNICRLDFVRYINLLSFNLQISIIFSNFKLYKKNFSQYLIKKKLSVHMWIKSKSHFLLGWIHLI